MLETTLAAPNLGRIGSRLRQDWIEQWLGDPTSVHSDPSMPAVLPENGGQHAADIAAFLSAGGSPLPNTDAETSNEFDGAAMFEAFGCITCHHFDDLQTEEVSGNRLSLHYAAAKYRPGAIVDFLLDPDQHHAASRMPDFSLSRQEAVALAGYIREQSNGKITPSQFTGNIANGITAVATFGCQQCHALGSGVPMQSAKRPWRTDALKRGCLADEQGQRGEAPRFDWSESERSSVRMLVATSLGSLQNSHPAETSQRLVETLRCSACHDRDGVRSPRPLIMAEEGSGRLPEVIPSLTWLGEKFHPDWNRRLFAGELTDKPRPWLTARMPAFPAYANALASGLATEHAIDSRSQPDHSFDAELATIGERLTLETGLDCRQCHAIGDLQPRGDEKTKIALGINFVMIRDRMRQASYHRFMLDPPRYDINTKMIKLSENGITTKLKAVDDGDAKKQFEALWHYLQSLEP